DVGQKLAASAKRLDFVSSRQLQRGGSRLRRPIAAGKVCQDQQRCPIIGGSVVERVWNGGISVVNLIGVVGNESGAFAADLLKPKAMAKSRNFLALETAAHP